ncbi:hypothetical protein VPBG_00058 [Vibrio phage helene 12B3]|uniref:hypothetical protein n=1 Tax=Vibrio phage helene 12B3 TaxID=573173 RepID=UPI0002C0F146|nr:hypothetical protein VPBG_00058 [Vibrio phage helene 12B3]AGG57830.1 hypothetical protein VPBG_00058 [Vibrio phage helene 12B3]
MMKDLLLDWDTKDLIIEGGLKLTSQREAYYQSILLGLSLNLGEFFTHVNYGLPWIQNPALDLGTNVRYFLGNNFPDPELFIKKELDRHLLRQPFVESVDSSYDLDRSTRTMTYSAKINTVDEGTIEFQPYLLYL